MKWKRKRRKRRKEELVELWMLQGKGFQGDQDWLTLLSWRHPHVFFHLPCTLNYQVTRVSSLGLSPPGNRNS